MGGGSAGVSSVASTFKVRLPHWMISSTCSGHSSGTGAIYQGGLAFILDQMANDPSAVDVEDFRVQSPDGWIAQNDVRAVVLPNAQACFRFPAESLQTRTQAGKHDTGAGHSLLQGRRGIDNCRRGRGTGVMQA